MSVRDPDDRYADRDRDGVADVDERPTATYADRDRDGVPDANEARDRFAWTRGRRDVVVDRARGGVSLVGILTGVAVALGAMMVLSAIAGAIAVGTDQIQEAAADATPVEVGVGIGIALVVIQFIAYLWGGYTAGRMARGAGALNGVLVPVAALIIAAIVAAIVAAVGADAELIVPYGETRLPAVDNTLIDLGLWVGIGTLIAMLLGGLVGGMMGSRWHDRLEDRVQDRERDIDARRPYAA
jgi:hypothetical protein